MNFAYGTDYDENYGQRQLNIVDMFLEFDWLRINAKNAVGWAPLHLASFWGCTDVVSKLLKADAQLDIPTSMSIHPPIALTSTQLLIHGSNGFSVRELTVGLTPVQLALLGGHCECVKALLAAGADPGPWGGGPNTQSLSCFGHLSVLQIAVVCADLDLLAVLAKHGGMDKPLGKFTGDFECELPCQQGWARDLPVVQVLKAIHAIPMEAAQVLGIDWHIVLDPDNAMASMHSSERSQGVHSKHNRLSTSHGAHGKERTVCVDPVSESPHLLQSKACEHNACASSELLLKMVDVRAQFQELPCAARIMRFFGADLGRVVLDVLAHVEFIRMLQIEARDGTGLAEACAAGLECVEAHDHAVGNFELEGWVEKSAVVSDASLKKFVVAKHKAVGNFRQWIRVLTRQHQAKADPNGDKAGLPPTAASGAGGRRGARATEGEFDYLVVS